MRTSRILPTPARRILRALLTVAAVVLAASACGSSSQVQPVLQPGIEANPNSSQGASGDANTTPVSNAIQGADPADAEPAEVAPVEPEPVVAASSAAQDSTEDAEDSAAVNDSSVEQRPVIASAQGTEKFPELWIHSFQREGDVVRLDFTVRVQSPTPGESYYVRKTFSSVEDSQLTGEASNSLNAASFSGITLVDNVNGNRHLVLRDSQGACLCTSFPDYFISNEFPENFTTPGAALFPAPPQGVTSMTVLFPVFGSFELDLGNA